MDLKLIKIEDQGNIEKERVVIKALHSCNLNYYILFDSTFQENGVIPYRERHLFVFPKLLVSEGDYIWLYTKKGTYGTHHNTSNTTTHKIYWGLSVTIWNSIGDKAYLLHYDDWNAIVCEHQ